jgi:hypothetical protein
LDKLVAPISLYSKAAAFNCFSPARAPRPSIFLHQRG